MQRRKAELLADAAVLLDAIAQLAPAGRDPYTDADTLARAVEIGLLDAPHLRGNAAGLRQDRHAHGGRRLRGG